MPSTATLKDKSGFGLAKGSLSNLINGNFYPGEGTIYGDCVTMNSHGEDYLTLEVNFGTTIDFSTIYLGGANDYSSPTFVNQKNLNVWFRMYLGSTGSASWVACNNYNTQNTVSFTSMYYGFYAC